MAIGVVNTKYGAARGEELGGKYEGIAYFKGIPFAAPPVGELRWEAPQDPEPWEGVRDFKKFSPTAYQSWLFKDCEYPSVMDYDFYFEGYPEMSEDCLYLNVCTGAQNADEKRPVYIWLHGGGLNQGYSYEPEVDPTEMARKGAVVVQVGQRLNVFGYLCLPQISAAHGGVSGNYGLMDEVKALDWVYENIAQFGGDPENITVGGESGGSWKACALAVSPEAKGRVKRVIGESWIVWFMKFAPVKEYEKAGQDYLKYLGLDPDMSLEELKKLPPYKLVRDWDNRFSVPGDMVFDGKYVPCATMREAFDKFGGGMDYLGGANFGSGENNIFQSILDKESIYYYGHLSRINGKDANVEHIEPDTKERFYAHFKELLGDLYEKYDFPNLVPVTDETAYYMARRLAALGLCPPGKAALSHTLILHRIFGKYISNKYPGTKAYAYLFSQIYPRLEGVENEKLQPDYQLAWHGSDLYYAFAAMREGIPPKRKWRGVDYYVADVMSSYWVNFMKTGDPNGPGLPYWPAASDDYGYMEINAVMNSGCGVDSGLDALMYEYFLKVYEVEM